MGFLKKLVKETQSKDKDKYRKIYEEFAENYVNIFKEGILEEAQKGYSRLIYPLDIIHEIIGVIKYPNMFYKILYDKIKEDKRFSDVYDISSWKDNTMWISW